MNIDGLEKVIAEQIAFPQPDETFPDWQVRTAKDIIKHLNKTEKQVISGYHRPVCPTCERELHPEKNGVGVLDMAGTNEYEVYDADLWKCPGCGMQVIGGFGFSPISAHYEENFQKVISNYKTLFMNKG